MTLNDLLINRIVSFVKAESPEIFRLFKAHELRDRIRKHMNFNTLVCLWDGDEIAGVCIFNIKEEVCEVHHAIVGKQYQHKDLLKQMVRQGFLRYPFVKFIQFQRELKYKSKKVITIPIERFLQGA